jgi:hypothetical protein
MATAGTGAAAGAGAGAGAGATVEAGLDTRAGSLHWSASHEDEPLLATLAKVSSRAACEDRANSSERVRVTPGAEGSAGAAVCQPPPPPPLPPTPAPALEAVEAGARDGRPDSVGTDGGGARACTTRGCCDRLPTTTSTTTAPSSPPSAPKDSTPGMRVRLVGCAATLSKCTWDVWVHDVCGCRGGGGGA